MKTVVLVLLISAALAALPALSGLNQFRTYWVPDDESCLAEFEIISKFADADVGTATTEHLLFAYVEVFHGDDESNPERGD